MNWPAFAAILLVNTTLALGMAVLLGRGRRAPGTRAMTLTFIALAVWSFGYAMIILASTLSARIAWLKFENIGIVTTPVFWFLFALYYTRKDKSLPRPALALLFVVPAITLVLLFSGQWLDLYYSDVQGPAAGLGPLHIGRGSWYWVQLVQNYLLLLAGFGLLLWELLRLRSVYRRQIAFVLAALAVPLVINVFYQRGTSLFPGVDPAVDLTPISLMVTATLVTAGVIGLRLFDLIPIARNIVFESIPEMVLVLDAQNRVLDANQITFSLLGKPAHEVLGRHATEVFSAWPEVTDRFLNGNEVREEVHSPDEPPSTYELTISPIYSRPGILEGRVVLARDVTDRKSTESELLRTNEALTTEIAQRQMLQAQLDEQATRDPLTGAFNRRYLAEVLEQEVARSQRERSPLSVIILDVDHFKQFNDRYGHKCGDLVLHALSDMLREESRRSDIVCRYGGEEFVIAMFNTPLDAAAARAEEWRARFEGMTLSYEGRYLRSTFSAGVANLPLHGTDSEAILRAADRALYRSKSEGRNRVTTADDSKRALRAEVA